MNAETSVFVFIMIYRKIDFLTMVKAILWIVVALRFPELNLDCLMETQTNY